MRYRDVPPFFLQNLGKSISCLSFFFFGVDECAHERGVSTLLKVLKKGINPQIRSFTITLNWFLIIISYSDNILQALNGLYT